MEANWKWCAALPQFLTKWPIQKKTTYLNFILQTTKTIAGTPNALLRITKQLLPEVSTRSFLGTHTTLLNFGRVTQNAFYSRLAKALQHWISLPKTALLNHPREIQMMSFNLFICVAANAVLLSINKATICISSRFYSRTIAFAILVCCYFWCENASTCSSDIICHQVWSQVFKSATWDFQVHLSQVLTWD